MKNQGIKQLMIAELIAKGIDFNLSAFDLHNTELTMLADYAKECKYKRSKTSYFGPGGSFFLHLQKIYKKDRLLHQDLNNL